MRFWPRSLVGQIAAVMAVALLVAQAINFGLLLTERQRATRAQAEAPAIARFLSAAARFADLEPEVRERRVRRGARRLRFELSDASPVLPALMDESLTERLLATAQANVLPVTEARAATSNAVAPLRRVLDPQQLHARQETMRTLILSVRLADGTWLTGRVLAPRPDAWLPVRLGASTLLLYLIVLGAMIGLAARIVRPLRALEHAARTYSGHGEAPVVEALGPDDLRRAIEAFNVMAARVSAMLDEKDRMLGAIGHDLRTPLASLRIRAEGVEPEEQSRRMIATIEEMTAMLDDTLALARLGRTREPARAVDIAALADALVEELRDAGQAVTLRPGGRVVGTVRPNLVRRALRNLIDNAVKYGGGAEVSVTEERERIVLTVVDRGPGIPEHELGAVQQAFYRLEPSRNRETGGSGLGLALARAAAEAHNGALELANREGGGLEARLFISSMRT